MRTAALLIITCCAAAWTARADFSYTTTRKTTGAMASAAGAANNQMKYYFKGQKLRVDAGTGFSIIDFDAQTITNVNNAQKTVSVRKFSDIDSSIKSSEIRANIDVRETGQTKTINGYTARELVLTMEPDTPATAMGKVQMEMDMWLSPDVPGAREMHAFYERNVNHFPWRALGNGGSNQTMEAAMADLQKKIAEMNGVPVLQVMKVRMGGGAGAAGTPQMTPEQQARMKDAMARLQTLQAQGGPAAAAAAQAMARMGATSGGQGSGGPMIEITMESSDFSTSSLPDSTFAVPAGYQKVDK